MMAQETMFGTGHVHDEAQVTQQPLRTDGLPRRNHEIQVGHRAQTSISVHAVNEEGALKHGRQNVSILKRSEHVAQDTQPNLVRSPMMGVLYPQLACYWSW
tara:strand:- start:116 stop:418 length:303 start_codon:yes stop_codon:yes gene_type:complete